MNEIDVLDFLKFEDAQEIPQVKTIMVPAEMETALRYLRDQGIYLKADHAKTEGIHIVNEEGSHLTHVTVFANAAWRADIQERLTTIVLNPGRFGLVPFEPVETPVDESIQVMRKHMSLNVFTMWFTAHGYWFLLGPIFGWMWASELLLWLGLIGCALWAIAIIVRTVFFRMPHWVRLIGAVIGVLLCAYPIFG